MQNYSFNPQAILLDIDKTMTNSAGEITQATKNAIKKIIKSGIKVGVCSGRMYPTINDWVLPLFPDESLHIMGGGGQIIDSTGVVKWSKEIPSQKVKEVGKKLDELGAIFGFAVGDIYYANDKLLPKISNHPHIKKCDSVSNLENWQTAVLYVSNLNQEIKEFLISQSDLNLKQMISNVTHEEYFDITAKGVNKAVAAQVWAELNNVNLEKVIAVGDGENDMEILDAVGWGVAMGNAVSELKEIADEVIGSNDEEGLSVFLGKLVI